MAVGDLFQVGDTISRKYTEVPGIVREKVVQLLSNGKVANLPIQTPMTDIVNNAIRGNQNVTAECMGAVNDVKIISYDTDKFLCVYASSSQFSSDTWHVSCSSFQVLSDGSIIFMDNSVISSSSSTSGYISGFDAIALAKLATSQILIIYPSVASSAGQVAAITANIDSNGGITLGNGNSQAIGSNLGAYSPQYVSVAYDPASSIAIICYTSSGTGYTYITPLGISSGTSPYWLYTPGATVTVSTSHPNATSLCVLNSNKYLLSYIVGATVYYAVITSAGTLTAPTCAVATGPLTFSTIYSSSYAYISSLQMANDQAVLVFTDSASTAYPVGYTVAFSGNTLSTTSTKATLSTTSINYRCDLAKIDSTHFGAAGYSWVGSYRVDNTTSPPGFISGVSNVCIGNQTYSRCIGLLSNNRFIVSSTNKCIVLDTSTNAGTNNPLPQGSLSESYSYNDTDNNPYFPVKISETQALLFYGSNGSNALACRTLTYDPSTDSSTLSSPVTIAGQYNPGVNFRAIMHDNNHVLIFMPGSGNSALSTTMVTISGGVATSSTSRTFLNSGIYSNRALYPSGVVKLRNSDNKYVVLADDGSAWNIAFLVTATSTSTGIISAINVTGYAGFGGTGVRALQPIEYLRYRNGEHIIAFSSGYTSGTSYTNYYGYIKITDGSWIMSTSNNNFSNYHTKYMIALDEDNFLIACNCETSTAMYVVLINITEGLSMTYSQITSYSGDGIYGGQFLKLGNTLYNFFASTVNANGGKMHAITISDDTIKKTSSNLISGILYNFTMIPTVTGVKVFTLSGKIFLAWGSNMSPYLKVITPLTTFPGMTIGVQDTNGNTITSGIAKLSGGLVAGMDYYYDEFGNLSPEGGGGRKPIGTALSSTELMITTNFPNRTTPW